MMCHVIGIYLKFSNYPLQSHLELRGTQHQTMSESTLDEPKTQQNVPKRVYQLWIIKSYVKGDEIGIRYPVHYMF